MAFGFKCGAPLKPDDIFCTVCGTQQLIQYRQTPPSAQQPASEQQGY